MNSIITYIIIFMVLTALELLYFKIAHKYNIIDKPGEMSSHSGHVLRGGGIIFTLGAWIWSIFFGFLYPLFLASLTMIAILSFLDDIKSLPSFVRLVGQFIAMAMMFDQINIPHFEMWWVVALAIFVSVGAANIINFMDGINGITGGYSTVVIVSLLLTNQHTPFIYDSFLLTILLALTVFNIFNFRPRGKAKCFAGDVGSIGIAFVILFSVGKLIAATGDYTYLVFLLVYGVDGALTICHRIILGENLSETHRKHAYQLMANELKMNHMTVSLFYMMLQLLINLCFIYMIPDTTVAHCSYLFSSLIVLGVAYLIFIKKYYHLHKEYIASLIQKHDCRP